MEWTSKIIWKALTFWCHFPKKLLKFTLFEYQECLFNFFNLFAPLLSMLWPFEILTYNCKHLSRFRVNQRCSVLKTQCFRRKNALNSADSQLILSDWISCSLNQRWQTWSLQDSALQHWLSLRLNLGSVGAPSHKKRSSTYSGIQKSKLT